MKVDDDTFVNLPLLYDQLTTSDQYRDLQYLLMGHCSLEMAMAPLKPKRLKVIIALENINEYIASIYLINKKLINDNLSISLLPGNV